MRRERIVTYLYRRTKQLKTLESIQIVLLYLVFPSIAVNSGLIYAMGHHLKQANVKTLIERSMLVNHYYDRCGDGGGGGGGQSSKQLKVNKSSLDSLKKVLRMDYYHDYYSSNNSHQHMDFQ